MTPEEIDKFISAQLPDQSVDPIGFKAVSSFMIHGPCGAANPSCSCMVDGECSKYYPKDFCDRTTMLQNGHVRYARPNNGRTTHKNGIDVDNRSVVPHNVDLSNIKPTSMWKESIATAWKNTCLSIFARDLTVQRLGYSIEKQPLNLQRKLLMRYVIT